MKYTQIILATLISILLSGCWWNNNALENYQGSSDARVFHENKFQNKFLDDTEACIKDGDKWEIWLEDLKFNQLFEGAFENFTDDTDINMNELTLKVTIEFRQVISKGNTQQDEAENSYSKILDFKQGIAKNVSPNADDMFIYAGVANNSDITIKIEVIEYDDHVKELINESVEILEDTINSLMTQGTISLISKDTSKQVYNTFKSKLINKLKKNDLVFNHQTTLHACNTIEPEEQAKYLKKGYLTFIRKPANKNAEVAWEKQVSTDSNYRKSIPGDSSYITFRIVKRNSLVEYNKLKIKLEKKIEEQKQKDKNEKLKSNIKKVTNVTSKEGL